MNYEKNPVFVKISGACSIGTENDKPNTSENSLESNMDTQLLPPPTSSLQKRPQKIIFKQETEETRNLSTQELQRLVLLEQLNVARLQAKREQLTINKLTNQPNHQADNNLGRQGGSSDFLSELREFIDL